MPDSDQNRRAEQFLRLLTAAEGGLLRYVFAMTGNPDATQEIYQETVLDLWQKFDDYDRSLPFVNWACRFGWIRVQRWRRAKGRNAALQLDEETAEALGAKYLADNQRHELRSRLLASCLEKLPEPARRLLEARYARRMTVEEIATQQAVTARAVYKRIDKVRHWLKSCIERQTGTGLA